MSEITFSEAQERINAWIGQFEEGYWPPLANLARLTEEVGELARLVNHQYGPKRKKSSESTQELALEIGDVLFVLLALANEQGIDVGDALLSVLAKYEERDSTRWARRDGAGGEG